MATKYYYAVEAPDGEMMKRKSSHVYTHVVFYSFDGSGWGAAFRSNDKAADSFAQYLRTCPGVKEYGHTVEVIIKELS